MWGNLIAHQCTFLWLPHNFRSKYSHKWGFSKDFIRSSMKKQCPHAHINDIFVEASWGTITVHSYERDWELLFHSKPSCQVGCNSGNSNKGDSTLYFLFGGKNVHSPTTDKMSLAMEMVLRKWTLLVCVLWEDSPEKLLWHWNSQSIKFLEFKAQAVLRNKAFFYGHKGSMTTHLRASLVC